MTTDARNVAVLVGNGLSIAFNPELNLRSITAEMIERIRNASVDGSDTVRAMQEIAERALPDGVTSDDDFEILVGAFGAESRTLGYLQNLADLVSPRDHELREAIGRVSAFAEDVQDMGLSHVLEVIFERSHGSWSRAAELHELVESIVDEFDGRVTFGNLNYDTLLLSALLTVCREELADLGHGYRRVSVIGDDGEEIRVPALRESAQEFPSERRVRLLHLHGSLTYWRDRKCTVFAKLDTDHLRTHEQFEAVREKITNVRPAVVLANQRDKSDHVARFPFNVAYEMFARALHSTDSWLVIGYSFRDTPVNEMLRSEFAERNPKPSVLVVTYGDSPTRIEVERAFGWAVEDGPSEEWLTINRDGADGAHLTPEWGKFIDSVDISLS